MEQIYTPEHDYKVLVRCFTYNHSKYIEDALNGFAMQKTNFPFACLVMDDCSTDGEQEVIKAWMERECEMAKAEYVDLELSNVILVPHKTNEYCTFAFYLLKQNLYGTGEKKMKHVTPWREHCEYEALCEGDDYWIDPMKLSKQVSIFEQNKDCTLVYSGFKTVDENGVEYSNPLMEKYLQKGHNGLVFFDLLVNLNFIMTLTTMVRTRCLKNIPYYYYDYGIFLLCSRQGYCGFIPDIMASYRNNPSSLMNTNKDSLLPRFYPTVLNEIKYAINKSDGTYKDIYNHSMFKTIIGYILGRNVRKSTIKWDFLKLVLRYPSLYYYVIKGIIIKMAFESKLRKAVCQY